MKNKSKKPNREKKSIKQIKILKELTNLVRFYMLETKKIESILNWKKNWKKTEPNQKNQAKTKKIEPK